MSGTKSQSLEVGCECDKCKLRYKCFTEEKIFSDAVQQGMFEAFIALGMDRDNAINAVVDFLRTNITRQRAYEPPAQQYSDHTIYYPFDNISTPVSIPAEIQNILNWNKESWSGDAVNLGVYSTQKRDSPYSEGR